MEKCPSVTASFPQAYGKLPGKLSGSFPRPYPFPASAGFRFSFRPLEKNGGSGKNRQTVLLFPFRFLSGVRRAAVVSRPLFRKHPVSFSSQLTIPRVLPGVPVPTRRELISPSPPRSVFHRPRDFRPMNFRRKDGRRIGRKWKSFTPAHEKDGGRITINVAGLGKNGKIAIFGKSGERERKGKRVFRTAHTPYCFCC